jgi:hypothetical protein
MYVCLMKDLTLSETLLAKHAYERFLASLGVESKAYHADNGRFVTFWYGARQCGSKTS